jgi:hypothetical protein
MNKEQEHDSRRRGAIWAAGAFISSGSSIGLALLLSNGAFGVGGLISLCIFSLFVSLFMIMQTPIEGLVSGGLLSGGIFALNAGIEAMAVSAQKAGKLAPHWLLIVSPQLNYWLIAIGIAFVCSRVIRYILDPIR